MIILLRPDLPSDLPARGGKIAVRLLPANICRSAVLLAHPDLQKGRRPSEHEAAGLQLLSHGAVKTGVHIFAKRVTHDRMTPADLITDFDARESASRTNAVWLAKQTSAASAFASVEHLATAGDDEVDLKWRRSFDHHLRHLRAGVARVFMRRDCFVGFSVIDELIFGSVTAGGSDVVSDVFHAVVGNQLHDPGMIVFPLHGFGIARPMRATFGGGPHPQLLLESAGLIVLAQTNDNEKTITLLDEARSPMGIAHGFDGSGLRSYTAGDRLSWLHRNPVMAFRFNSYSQDPYENQLFYQLRMRTLTALLYIGSLFAPQLNGEMDSSRANNQETLDINHYLRIEVSPSLGRLEAERIPRNVDALSLVEASDVDVRISLAGWNKLKGTGELDRHLSMLRHIESGYLTHHLLDRRETKEASLYLKLVRSLDYFRRSFRADVRPSERVITLAIAFETLLTDSYSGGVTARIRRRAAMCLAQAGAAPDLNVAVEQLFEARGKFVHSGFGPENISLHDARLAYVACLSTVTRVAEGATLSDPVIGNLLADKPSSVPLWVRLKQAWRILRGS